MSDFGNRDPCAVIYANQVNAETDGGGIPSWVLTSAGGYRRDAQPYLSAAPQWYSEIDSIIAPRADDVQRARRRDGDGAVNISGQDSYPLFAENCGQTTRGFGNPPTLTVLPGEPFTSPEYQAGSLEYWGTAGFPACYNLTGPDFENVHYKDNLAQGIAIQSNYMGAGGTNWGWLPDPEVYTSYDYGAAVSETGELGTPTDPDGIAGSKYGQNKLIGDFAQAVSPLTETVPVAAPVADTTAVTGIARANPVDGTQFLYLRQADASSTAAVSAHVSLDLDQNGTYTYESTNSALQYSGDWTHGGPGTAYAWDPGQTEATSSQAGASVTVSFTGTAVQWIGQKNSDGGIADVSVDGTQAAIGGHATALLYDPQGTDGETVLRYAARPGVQVLDGSVQVSWDAARGDLRLDYVHDGLAGPDHRRRRAAAAVADRGHRHGRGLLAGVHVRGQCARRGRLPGQDRCGARRHTRADRRHIPDRAADRVGSGRGSFCYLERPARRRHVRPRRLAARDHPGTRARDPPRAHRLEVQLRDAGGQPGFDDSSWTLADHPVSNVSSPSDPVLYASDYGYGHGFVWYRGHFTATGTETGVTLTADGIYPTGAYSVWLNGTFLGSGAAPGKTAQTFAFPAGTLRPAQDNVIAVLVRTPATPRGRAARRRGCTPRRSPAPPPRSPGG